GGGGEGGGGVGIGGHGAVLGEAGKRLVDGVVDDLVDHVVQARAVVGVADIHARPLAHGVETLEHLDRLGVVIGCVGDRFAGGFGHAWSLKVSLRMRVRNASEKSRKNRHSIV